MRHWRKYLQNELPQVHASLSFQSGLCTAEPALGIQLAEEIWGPSVSRTVSFSDPPTLQGSVSQQEPLQASPQPSSY